MRDLQKIAKECMKELDVLGIEYGNIVSFKINTRFKSTWGQCKLLPNKKYEIDISQQLLNDTIPIKSLKSTIMHEILHTCKNCYNHGQVWKRYAERVSKAYGYNIKRCTSSEEKGVKEIKSVKKIIHQFVCNGCGQVVDRERESRFTKNYTEYRCGMCGSDFKKIF